MNALTEAEARDRLARLRELRTKLDAEADSLARMVAGRQSASRRRSRHIRPDCGTEDGYQWHRYRGEKCEPCRVAHAAHNRQQQRARRAQLDAIIEGAA